MSFDDRSNFINKENLLFQQPTVILSAIHNIINIDSMILNLEYHEVSFFKYKVTIHIARNKFPDKPRTSEGHHF